MLLNLLPQAVARFACTIPLVSGVFDSSVLIRYWDVKSTLVNIRVLWYNLFQRN